MNSDMPVLTTPSFKLHNPETGEDMVADDFMIWPVSEYDLSEHQTTERLIRIV